MDTKYKIIDNALSSEQHSALKNLMMGYDFPWYFNQHVVNNDETELEFSQLTHLFFVNLTASSSFFPAVKPLIDVLQPAALIRIKANLNHYSPVRVTYPYHVDVFYKHAKTALYYINTNDGITKFKTGEIIESIENRLVIFDAHHIHTGTNCQDQKARCLININYFDKISDKVQNNEYH
jgi:hypothetical protein